ncbi:MAG: hypothetical protein Q4A84_07980 [Neisseria sp.]|uniref:hypothetical protein n=1 Tax=Neisseria sp. TaxID=192066 RepID=UPI0026DAEE78|nr:hypothetical protein [Neisseria sp.]MDO4641619.1 hypothetical protein [Neisseria sp.]
MAYVQAGTIYECNGVYTDKPSAECRSSGQADLPSIGKYTSLRPRAAEVSDMSSFVERAPSQAAKRTVSRSLPMRRPSAEQQAAYKMPQPSASVPSVVATKPAEGTGRRSILEQELNNERKALAQAQADLIRARAIKDGVINQQQISGLQSHVLDRQQNIQALQRELGRM